MTDNGPSRATHSRRSLFIETQAFVENKLELKSGAIFAADKPSLECHDKLTVKHRHKYLNLPTGGIHVKPLARNTDDTHFPAGNCSFVPVNRTWRNSKKRLSRI